MTAERFRQMALALPEAKEAAHMKHPDFRVNGRIFATLGYPEKTSAVVKLTRAEQKQLVRSEPEVFKPAIGAWGRRGYTRVHLSAAKIDTVREALIAAWRNTAPKRLARQFDQR